MSKINYELLSEIIFMNDSVFNHTDIDTAKNILCSCKNARLNKHIKLSFDRIKTREYFGPVKLEKLRIRLLNKFGHVIDMNQNDFSISFEIKENYN